MATMLDAIRRLERGEAPPPPVASLIGFRLREVEAGHAMVDFEAEPRHANPMGTLHGGILCDVAGHLVARASSTCMTLRGAQARGRSGL